MITTSYKLAGRINAWMRGKKSKNTHDNEGDWKQERIKVWKVLKRMFQQSGRKLRKISRKNVNKLDKTCKLTTLRVTHPVAGRFSREPSSPHIKSYHSFPLISCEFISSFLFFFEPGDTNETRIEMFASFSFLILGNFLSFPEPFIGSLFPHASRHHNRSLQVVINESITSWAVFFNIANLIPFMAIFSLNLQQGKKLNFIIDHKVPERCFKIIWNVYRVYQWTMSPREQSLTCLMYHG